MIKDAQMVQARQLLAITQVYFLRTAITVHFLAKPLLSYALNFDESR